MGFQISLEQSLIGASTDQTGHADGHRLRLDQRVAFDLEAALTASDHISTVKALSPRKRLETAEPRNLNIYWYLPTHLLLLGVGQVFAVLNPIVIACVDDLMRRPMRRIALATRSLRRG